MYTTIKKQAIKPYKALNTVYTCMGSGLAVNELVGLAVQLVAKEPHQNQSKYLNCVVIA